MAIYSVLEPPEPRDASVENAVVIKDGFAIFAFIAPLLWFLWHRMWWEALSVVVISIALGLLGSVTGFQMASLAGLLISVFVGLEARGLWAAHLRRRGWRDWGVVVASSYEEAELRYVTEALADDTGEPLPAQTAMPQVEITYARPAPQVPAFGLIDYPRKS